MEPGKLQMFIANVSLWGNHQEDLMFSTEGNRDSLQTQKRPIRRDIYLKAFTVLTIWLTFELCHKKMCHKIFVSVIPKEMSAN